MRRWIPLILALLLAGAIVNVAVAWGCAWRVSTGALDGHCRIYELLNESPARLFVYPGFAVLNCPPRHWESNPSLRGITVSELEMLSHIPLSRRQWDDLKSGPHGSNTFMSGWPAYSCIGRSMFGSGDSGLIALDSKGRLQSDWDKSPYMVLWPGFAVNTIFYAAILGTVFFVPRVLRRKRRLKRGLCPKCAYPTGVSEVCTECGAALPSPSR